MEMVQKSKFIIESFSNLKDEQPIQQRCPFVMDIQFSFEDESYYYYCVEYVPGGGLATYLRQYRKFPNDVAKFYASEVLLSIEYYHSRGKIIYQDLKPERIFLDKQGHIKIVDFGLKTKPDRAATKGFVIEGDGSPRYAAPEILSKKPIDRMVDFWAYGCLLYEMLVGKPPFSSQSHQPSDVLVNIQKVACNANLELACISDWNESIRTGSDKKTP